MPPACSASASTSRTAASSSPAAARLCGRYVTGPYRFAALDGASLWLPEPAPDQVAALLTEHFAAAS